MEDRAEPAGVQALLRAGQCRYRAAGAEDIERLGDFAEEAGIDLTVVGPERPLIAGIVDHFRSRGLPIYGPTAAAARLEGSKAFTNELAERAGIASKEFAVFSNAKEARAYVQEHGAPIVVKADSRSSAAPATEWSSRSA